MPPRLGSLVLALVSLAGAGWVSTKVADRLGQRMGVALARALGNGVALSAPAREPAAPALAPPSAQKPAADALEPSRPGVAAAPLVKKGKQPKNTRAASAPERTRADRNRAPVATRGIRVSGETVLHLAGRGARPAGMPVPASRGCPAGLRLTGVSGLGVGLRDGDVLTHAAGRPATKPAEVVASVISARGARQTEVSGRFCRDGEAWNLVVEQPYPSGVRRTGDAVASHRTPAR